MPFSFERGIAGMWNRAEKVAPCGAGMGWRCRGLRVKNRVEAGNVKLLAREHTLARTCRGHVDGAIWGVHLRRIKVTAPGSG